MTKYTLDEVNDMYVDVLKEIGNVGSGNAATAIANMVGTRIDMKVPNVKLMDVGKLGSAIGPEEETVIAKIAAKYKVEHDKKVAMLTADTYRIAAAEQLKIYANILDAPVKIIYSAEELNQSLETLAEYDLVFVDTAGFSHKNEEQREDIKKLVNGLDLKYEKEVYLVLSATTKYKDLMEIVDIYREIAEYKIIFTKLDETTSFGNILNIRLPIVSASTWR